VFANSGDLPRWLSAEVVLLQLVGRDKAVVFSKEMAGQHTLRGQRQRADPATHPLRPHLHLSTHIKSKKCTGTVPTKLKFAKKGIIGNFFQGSY